MSALDVKLTVRPSDPRCDWWTIERAEYDAQYSSRINSAYVEGDSSEMLAIAEAIERHDSYEAHRCACHWSDDGVDLWSPRKSYIATLVTHASALELAAEIRREVKP